MGITADRLLKLGLVDEVIPEPLGGAHRDPEAMAETVRNALLQGLAEIEALPTDTLLQQRHQRLSRYGVFKEA
jgi:acetyl-CoA carboxylase carboxyl transferase subunit alpha